MKNLTNSANKLLVIGVFVSAFFSASSMANEQDTTLVKLAPTAVQITEVKTTVADDLANTVQNQLNQMNAAINEQIESSIKQINQQISAKIANLF
ncbi:hypothetical protein [Pseudoalteromonas sp. SaAl2]